VNEKQDQTNLIEIAKETWSRRRLGLASPRPPRRRSSWIRHAAMATKRRTWAPGRPRRFWGRIQAYVSRVA